MNLRELKNEAHALNDVSKDLQKFHDNWLKPIRANTNKHLPFLKKLPDDLKDKVNKKLYLMKKNSDNLRHSQIITSKLQSYSRYLIELKLTTLNENHGKAKMIANMLVNDEFLKMKNTISDIKSFDDNLKEFTKQYHEVNRLLEKKLSLEEVLFLMELPHKKYLYNLKETSKKQKKIVRHIGRHFVSLTKKTVLNKNGR